ncbi:antibiotic biosynthesis monooxygenase [Brevirhabdus pacifica]|uniref:Antibiotic biosynthesis monooxygenase n=1 Tax=Brevirhabdus pacifica TaxID=1267768 RepID=A0A1U7DMM7_9RHOB|nr:antibiotic biosynthesis monooxygenase [Brevirhabdus pacifica]APX91143.1 antibiotic biosynthesis monooxygenase [Brevirhabdus pacifica]OWU78856.1 antibiotic biosynthesis monooxygenase [Loktanella sp. 22II-4b]PJJ85469.1 antibiotic biosynthesis monooxygenase [Brevirhabdus pacifica]
MTDGTGHACGDVQLTGQLICTSEQYARIVRRRLPEHVRLTLAEPGCISFTVAPTDDPFVWSVEEHFRDAKAFRAHQDRARASAWGRATADISRSYRITGLDGA